MRRAFSLLALILCLVMVFTCFSACGQKAPVTSETVEWIEDDDDNNNEDTNSEDDKQQEEKDTSSKKEDTSSKKEDKDDKTSSKEDSSAADDKLDFGGGKLIISTWAGMFMPEKTAADYKNKTKLISDIEKKYNCKIEWKPVNDSIAYYKAFATATMAGTKYADIVPLPGDQGFPDAIANGYMLQLDKYMSDFDDVTMFSKNTDTILKVNGKHYFLQNTGAGGVDRGLFFNQKVLDACGVKKSPHDLYDEGNWNWDTFREIAIACTKKIGATQYYGLASVNMRPWIMSNNGAIYKTAADGTQSFNLDSKECMEALRFMYDLYNVDKVLYPIVNGSTTQGDNAFVSGYVAMATEDAYVYANTDFKFVEMPIGKSANDYVCNMANGQVWGIPVTVIDKKKSEAENTKKVNTLLAVWRDYFDPTYKWRQNTEEYISTMFNDEKSVEIGIKRSNRLASTSNRYWLTYYEWSFHNVVWGNFGLGDPKVSSPEGYIASNKGKMSEEIDSVWKKLKAQTK